MCYEWGCNGAYHEKKKLKRIDPETAKSIIEECSTAKPHYELFGGEPLLYPEIDEILFCIKQNGSTVDIPTNGTMLKQCAEMLVRTGADNLWISLDGPREANDCQRGRGVYDKIISGIDKVFVEKKKQGKSFPDIGISSTVTQRNYTQIDKLFLECLDMKKINLVSLELQQYITAQRHFEYESLLKEQFQIQDAPISKGLIYDAENFKGIDKSVLSGKVNLIKDVCRENNILFNCYPRTINDESLNCYYNAEWKKIPGGNKRCPFPWLSTEISAGGDVASCHALYDLTYGNIYNEKLLDIWHNEKYEKFREIIKKQLLPVCPGCCLYYNKKYTDK